MEKFKKYRVQILSFLLLGVSIFVLVNSAVTSFQESVFNVNNGFHEDMNEVIDGEKRIDTNASLFEFYSNTSKAVGEEVEKAENTFFDVFGFILFLAALSGFSVFFWLIKTQ